MTVGLNNAPTKGETPWLVISRPNPGAALRLFCFPYAGGSTQIYRTWTNALPSTVEMCAVELPGRGRRLREQNHHDLMTLVAEAFKVLSPYMNKPFAFFGHSMGALMSFELARLLRREGRPAPARIFVSARRAPQIPDIEPPTYNLPEDEFIAELRRLNGTPQEVLEHNELLQLMLPILRADFSVCQTYGYVPEPPLDVGITAYGGVEDKDVSREQLEAWGQQTGSDFNLRMMPGDHFFIHSSQAQLLQSLSQELHGLVRNIVMKG
ncbi:MAG: thioesterase II family protein [Pyrinomonadaceae bacterium]